MSYIKAIRKAKKSKEADREASLNIERHLRGVKSDSYKDPDWVKRMGELSLKSTAANDLHEFNMSELSEFTKSMPHKHVDGLYPDFDLLVVEIDEAYSVLGGYEYSANEGNGWHGDEAANQLEELKEKLGLLCEKYGIDYYGYLVS